MLSGTPTLYNARMPYADAVAIGIVPGVTPVIVSGENPDIDSGNEDVWDLGALYDFLTVARTLTLTTSSSTDNPTGTGARSVRVQGLDANWDPFDETFAMNGLTPVPITTPLIRVNRITVATAGSVGTNNGAVAIVADVDLFTLATMFIGAGSSANGIYSVARNHVFSLAQLALNMTRANQPLSAMCTFVLKVRVGADGPEPSVVRSVRGGLMIEAGGGNTTLAQPQPVGGGSDAWLHVVTVTDMDTQFTGLMVGRLYDLAIVTPALLAFSFLAPFLGGLKMAAAAVGA